MRNLKFLLVAAMIMAWATASAQFANGGKGSNSGSSADIVKSYDRIAVSYNSYKISLDDDDADDYGLTGIGAEWIHGFSLSSSTPIYLETGLKYIYAFKSEDDMSFKGETNGCKLKMSTMNIAVPINVAYRFTLPNNSDVSITPFTGITLKGNLTMKEKCEYDGYNTKDVEKDWFDKKDVGNKYTAKRFQVGWQIGAGLSYKALYLGLSYGLDFTELAKKTKTSNFAVSLGYNF